MEEGAGIGGGRGGGGGEEGELDPLDVLLEKPVIDEGLLPLRDKLRLQILRELHHLPSRPPPPPPSSPIRYRRLWGRICRIQFVILPRLRLAIARMVWVVGEDRVR